MRRRSLFARPAGGASRRPSVGLVAGGGASSTGLSAAVSKVVERARRSIRETVDSANTTTEREVVAVGEALNEVVAAARSHIQHTRASFEALAGNDGEQSVAELLVAQSSLASTFADDVTAVLDRQRAAAARTSSLSTEIVALGKKIGDVAFQSRLLSLNASVEAARLGEDGTTFGTIALEMRRLTEAVESTNKTMSRIAREICEVLPEIESHAETLRTRSEDFSTQMQTQLKRVDSATSMLSETLRNSQGEADQRLEAIIGASQRALSHLQFQDTTAQQLVSAAKNMDKAADEITSLVAQSGAGDMVVVQQPVVSVRPSAAASNKPASGIEAGEVMLF